MNSYERIKAVIALETPDRVPLAPLLDHFAATYAGITNAELMTDGEKRISAVLKTMQELGPWDMTFVADTANALLLKMGVPARLYLPGKELPEKSIHQFEETEFLKPENYDLLRRIGVIRFLGEIQGQLHPEIKGLKVITRFLPSLIELRRHRKMISKAGSQMACGFVMPGPLFDYFSLGRGMRAMSMDLYDHPEKIKSASPVWAKGFTNLAINCARFIGAPRIFIGLARSSPTMISPRHFEEFVLPELEYMVNTIIDAGMTPLLHCDTDWTNNFPLFKKFPKAKCILELDGHSDIFKAKESLGDHMCIMGDVPAYLLAFGKREEIMNYCQRLIQEVGKGGGFILSSGCSIPANAKSENVKALLESVEEWGWY